MSTHDIVDNRRGKLADIVAPRPPNAERGRFADGT